MNIFLPFSRLPPYFADDLLCYAEAFQFDIVLLFIFLFTIYALGVISKKVIAKTNVKELLPPCVSCASVRPVYWFHLVLSCLPASLETQVRFLWFAF